MKMWIISIAVALLLIAGMFAVTNFVKAEQSSQSQTPSIAKCSSCNGQCTAANNCGLATCGAVSGKTCGCQKSP